MATWHEASQRSSSGQGSPGKMGGDKFKGVKNYDWKCALTQSDPGRRLLILGSSGLHAHLAICSFLEAKAVRHERASLIDQPRPASRQPPKHFPFFLAYLGFLNPCEGNVCQLEYLASFSKSLLFEFK